MFALDKNPYLELLSGSKTVPYFAFRCKKTSHKLHIEVQVMCKRIGSHSQMIYDQHATSQEIIEEVSCQRIDRGQNQACYPRVGRSDILAPLQSSFCWLILAFFRMYCA